MRVSRLPSLFALLALAALFFTAPASRADTYQLFNLGTDNSMSFLGLSSSGQAFFDSTNPSACSGGPCYYTYLNGIRIGTSSIAPTFTVDDGTICSPSLGAGWSAFRAVCNSGRVAFTGTYGGNPPTGVYFDTNPAPPAVLTQIGGSGIWMNSIGNVIFDDGFQNNWYEAVDLNTAPAPEPSSLLLLTTGILALGALTCRNRRLA